MNEIKLLAIDLDETLLRSDNTVSVYTKRVLQAALAQGIRVVIATGRMFCSARKVAVEIGLSDVPLISYSGGLIAKCNSGAVLYHHPIPVAVANEVLARARQLDSCIQVYINDQLHVETRNDRVKYYEMHCGISAVVDGNDFWRVKEAPTKIIFNEPDPEKMSRIKTEMPLHLEGRIHFVQSSPMFFEMVAPHVSKGVAVEQLCLRYGIGMSSVMAFGNANNDLGMLRAVGWPVAVANAIDEVKEIARIITDSNENDGVARAIEKYVLKELS